MRVDGGIVFARVDGPRELSKHNRQQSLALESRRRFESDTLLPHFSRSILACIWQQVPPRAPVQAVAGRHGTERGSETRGTKDAGCGGGAAAEGKYGGPAALQRKAYRRQIQSR